MSIKKSDDTALIGRILRREAGAALGADATQGNAALREAFAAYLRKLEIPASAHNVLVTTGSQQAIDLVVTALVRPGERVAVEEPTWPGALGALEAAGANIVGIPLDEQGIRLDALEEALAAGGVRLIYTVPTFHNPTGTVMPAGRRRELVRVAARYGVPILEDDALREVRFGGVLPPPLAALDTSGNVILDSNGNVVYQTDANGNYVYQRSYYSPEPIVDYINNLGHDTFHQWSITTSWAHDTRNRFYITGNAEAWEIGSMGSRWVFERGE